MQTQNIVLNTSFYFESEEGGCAEQQFLADFVKIWPSQSENFIDTLISSLCCRRTAWTWDFVAAGKLRLRLTSGLEPLHVFTLVFRRTPFTCELQKCLMDKETFQTHSWLFCSFNDSTGLGPHGDTDGTCVLWNVDLSSHIWSEIAARFCQRFISGEEIMRQSSVRCSTSYRFNIRSTTVEKQRQRLPDKKKSRKSNSIQQAL